MNTESFVNDKKEWVYSEGCTPLTELSIGQLTDILCYLQRQVNELDCIVDRPFLDTDYLTVFGTLIDNKLESIDLVLAELNRRDLS